MLNGYGCRKMRFSFEIKPLNGGLRVVSPLVIFHLGGSSLFRLDAVR